MSKYRITVTNAPVEFQEIFSTKWGVLKAAKSALKSKFNIKIEAV